MNYNVGDVVLVDTKKARDVNYTGHTKVTIRDIEIITNSLARLRFEENSQCCHSTHILGLATPLLEELV